MRNYESGPWQQIEDPKAQDFASRVDRFLRDLQAGMGRIQKGLVPDGSGNSLNPPALDNYWFKPGISSTFLAYMGTQAGQGGTISSTSASTKGKISFGASTVYDEENIRLGVGLTTPAANLHVQGTGSGSTVTLVASSDYNSGFNVYTTDPSTGLFSGWGLAGGAPGFEATVDVAATAGMYSAFNSAASPDTLYLTNDSAGGTADPQTCGLSAAAPTGRGTWTVSFTARWIGVVNAPGALLKVRLVLANGQRYDTGNINLDSVTTSWASYSATIDTSGAGTTAGHPNSVEIIGPVALRIFAITYLSLSYVDSPDIARATDASAGMALRVDGGKHVGVWTELDDLTSLFTIGRAAVDATLVRETIRGSTAQTGDYTRWINASDQVVLGVDSSGDIYGGDQGSSTLNLYSDNLADSTTGSIRLTATPNVEIRSGLAANTYVPYRFGIGTTGAVQFTINNGRIYLESTSGGATSGFPSVVVDNSNATNTSIANVLYKAIRKSGQTGDLFDFLDSNGTTVLASITAAGNYRLVAGAADGSVYVSDATGVGAWEPVATAIAPDIFANVADIYVSFGSDHGGQSNGAVITNPPYSGVVAVEVASVSLTGQTASIGTTALFTPTATGMFMVSAYMVCTTAGDAGDTVNLNLAWNDGSVAQTATVAPCALDTVGTKGNTAYVITANASAVSYSTTLSSPGAGAPAHTLNIKVQVL